MKTVIMAGGRGSRLAELTENTGNGIPKPMIPIEGNRFWRGLWTACGSRALLT